MEQYIKKSALVAKIKERIKTYNKGYASGDARRSDALEVLLHDIDFFEVKEMSMPALDNGNMPVERWKEACKAASCQANYRKAKGLTETRDDYFVDGVQWADEHPIKAKEADLEKEISLVEDKYRGFESLSRADIIEIIRYFFELGLKVNKSLTWGDIANINEIVSEILKECGENILYDTQEDFCKEVLKRFKAQKMEL